MTLDRYGGRPLTKLLDCYVLDALGSLDETSAAALVALEPTLHRQRDFSGGWREYVEAVMEFPDTLPSRIREIWEAGYPKFREAFNAEPDPVAFTHEFVDMNFPIDPIS